MSDDKLVCSFCGKTQKEVRKLIAGPSVYICDECIKLCKEIISEEGETHGDISNPEARALRSLLYIIEKYGKVPACSINSCSVTLDDFLDYFIVKEIKTLKNHSSEQLAKITTAGRLIQKKQGALKIIQGQLDNLRLTYENLSEERDRLEPGRKERIEWLTEIQSRIRKE
jgi:hypothetical protein